MNIVDEMNYFYYHMSLYELQVMNGSDYFGGLSYNSVLYLNVIDQTKDCTVSKIAEVLGITKSAVTLKINELEKTGAVVKTRSETDRRVYYVRLSPRMEETINIYNEVFKKIEVSLREKYTDSQLNLFGEIMHMICGCNWRKIQNE